jgi:hypothetical protein
MSEQRMIELSQAALRDHGIGETVIAVGQFAPRGQSGATFAGGMIGDELGGSIGFGAGLLAGRGANAMSAGLPRMMIVAVTESTVYGMHSRSRRAEPDEILFTLPRSQLTAKVHQRVNVRVLELIDDQSGASVELEGSRVPITHSKDVMDVLTESSGQPAT